jgi:2-alkyl-3-oxoalkanoate reductase
MKIFLAGATGALGKRLVPLLVKGGHQVVAATRSSGKTDTLRAAGAEPVVVDALDRDAVIKAVVSARPDVVVHQMTALASVRSLKKFDEEFALTNRLRTEGTEHLLAAARSAGTRSFIAQSYTGWPNIREGGRVKTENDPLDPNPPKTMRRTLDAIRQLETMVSSESRMTGIVLRYGGFYGPGTSLAPGGDVVEMVRQRKFPVIGNGAGVWSFIHIDDAANATRLAIERGASGIYNIVDDEPAEVSTWLPDLARAIGAKPPYHLPTWLGWLGAGEAGVSMMTRVRGSSNAKAKLALNWQPSYASWRDGFRRGFSAAAV